MLIFALMQNTGAEKIGDLNVQIKHTKFKSGYEFNYSLWVDCDCSYAQCYMFGFQLMQDWRMLDEVEPEKTCYLNNIVEYENTIQVPKDADNLTFIFYYKESEQHPYFTEERLHIYKAFDFWEFANETIIDPYHQWENETISYTGSRLEENKIEIVVVSLVIFAIMVLLIYLKFFRGDENRY